MLVLYYFCCNFVTVSVLQQWVTIYKLQYLNIHKMFKIGGQDTIRNLD